MSNVTKSIPLEPEWQEFLAMGCIMTTFNLFSFVINCITVFVISRTKGLRTPCFMLIGAHSMHCAILATGSFSTGIRYIGIALGTMPKSYPRALCLAAHLPSTFTGHPGAMVAFLIACERVMAILFPLVYRNREHAFVKFGLGSAVALGFLDVILAFATTPGTFNDEIPCYSILSGYGKTYFVYFNYFSLTFQGLALVIYAMTCFVLHAKKRNRVGSSSGSDPHGEAAHCNRSLERQLRLLPVFNTFTICYAIFGVGPPLIGSIFSVFSDGRYLQRTSIYATALKTMPPYIDFSVMMAKSAEFRSGLRSAVSAIRRKDTVQVLH